MNQHKQVTSQKKSVVEKITTFVWVHKYQLLVYSILLLSFTVRFYHFNERWGLGDDDSRDVAIAQEALSRHELPFTGSFSSAGPFVFGPFFYWLIMFCYLILPFIFSSPWIFTDLVSVLTVFIFIYCAKRLGGNRLALIVG